MRYLAVCDKGSGQIFNITQILQSSIKHHIQLAKAHSQEEMPRRVNAVIFLSQAVIYNEIEFLAFGYHEKLIPSDQESKVNTVLLSAQVGRH